MPQGSFRKREVLARNPILEYQKTGMGGGWSPHFNQSMRVIIVLTAWCDKTYWIGDGNGEKEYKMSGSYSGQGCIDKCKEERKSNPKINGATIENTNSR